VHISIYLFININQLDALSFIISLFQASTCFEHHVLIVRRAKSVLYSLWYHHTYKCDDTRGCIRRWSLTIHLALSLKMIPTLPPYTVPWNPRSDRVKTNQNTVTVCIFSFRETLEVTAWKQIKIQLLFVFSVFFSLFFQFLHSK